MRERCPEDLWEVLCSAFRPGLSRRTMLRAASLLALILTTLGCGSEGASAGAASSDPGATAGAPASPPPSARPRTRALRARTSAAPSLPTASAAPAPGSPDTPLTLAGHAEGVVPTTQADRDFLEASCAAFVKAIGKAEDEATSLKEREDDALIDKARSALPKGPDGDRCVEVHRRLVDEYLAGKVEAEAILVLGVIADGLQGAFDAEKKICPSAEPTPTVIAKQGDKWVGPEAYDTDAWRCIDFKRIEPQYYQYEVKTHAQARRFEIIARGYPLRKKGKLSELVFAARFREKDDPAWDRIIVRR